MCIYIYGGFRRQKNTLLFCMRRKKTDCSPEISFSASQTKDNKEHFAMFQTYMIDLNSFTFTKQPKSHQLPQSTFFNQTSQPTSQQKGQIFPPRTGWKTNSVSKKTKLQVLKANLHMQFTTSCNDMFTTLLSGANHQRIGFGPQVGRLRSLGSWEKTPVISPTETQQPMGLWVFFCWKILEECPTSVNFGPDSCWVGKLHKSSLLEKESWQPFRPIKFQGSKDSTFLVKQTETNWLQETASSSPPQALASPATRRLNRRSPTFHFAKSLQGHNLKKGIYIQWH